MMRFHSLLPGLALLVLGCQQDEELCEDTIDVMLTQTFTGTIYLCNAQPPEQEFLDGTATLSSPVSDQLAVHLVSDDSSIDTVLNYHIVCSVVEEDIPIVSIQNNAGVELGQYNKNPDRISFKFGYAGCLDNTFFEGVN